MSVIVWWEEDPEHKRVVVKNCLACYRDDDGDNPDSDPDVVSPTGVAHIGRDGGVTDCGRDATGPAWWWKS